MKWDATTNSNMMTAFFLKNNCMKHLSMESSPFLSAIRVNIVDAYNWIESEKKIRGSDFYKLAMSKIRSEGDIPLPESVPSGKYMWDGVFVHIKSTSVFKSTYTVDVFGKQIIIHFVFEKNGLSKKWKEPNIQTVNAYVDNMIMWFHIASKYTVQPCAQNLTVFIYLTSLEKRVPDLDEDVISPVHVNTGVTSSCPVSGEIIVYRHEEWFKVFIHETFHTLGLDFSSMNVASSETAIRSIFHIKTPILLYEAYTEFWARVMNVLIISFRLTKNEDAFEKYATFLLDYERVNCFFQMTKILQHMNIEYADLHTNTDVVYQEKSNVFVYYIVTMILLNNYPLFIRWCGDNNSKLLQFNQTEEQQVAFCSYITTHFNTPEIISGVHCAKRLLKKTASHLKKEPSSKKIKTILETLRMSLSEICIP